MIPEYTVLGIISVVSVVVLERRVFRTGVFGQRSYWITLGICLFFMFLVNGWLTKLSAPIVLYDPDQRTGWRAPWDIPVEDYLFGFAMLTLAIVLWERAGSRRAPAVGSAEASSTSSASSVESEGTGR